ncbi:hypothetical protein LEAN103870_02910 [Legionella anisa]
MIYIINIFENQKIYNRHFYSITVERNTLAFYKEFSDK